MLPEFHSLGQGRENLINKPNFVVSGGVCGFLFEWFLSIKFFFGDFLQKLLSELGGFCQTL